MSVKFIFACAAGAITCFTLTAAVNVYLYAVEGLNQLEIAAKKSPGYKLTPQADKNCRHALVPEAAMSTWLQKLETEARSQPQPLYPPGSLAPECPVVK